MNEEGRKAGRKVKERWEKVRKDDEKM